MSEPKKPWSLNSALDPEQYVEPVNNVAPRAVAWLEWRGIPAIPVYARWLRVDLSNHEALFQESGHHDEWPHVEASLVHGVLPTYQKFTGNVYGDFNAMALKGHDVGPFVPHISVPPTNTLMPLHTLSSSCKWPFTANRRLHRGNAFCAFFWIVAPYDYCSDNKKKDKKDEGKKDNKPQSGAESSSYNGLPIGVASGWGICMVPTGGKTVSMRLSLLDIVLGWVEWAINKAISKGFDRIWLVPGRDAKRHIRHLTKDAARKAGRQAVARFTRDKMINKAWKDAAKGFAMKWEVGVPFKLASYDFGAGKIKLWTYTFGGWNERLPEEQPLAEEPPRVEPPRAEHDGQTPNPAQEPSPQPPQEQEPLGPYDPSREFFDELLEGAPHAW